MTEPAPITTPPRRRADHPHASMGHHQPHVHHNLPHLFSAGSDSCKNTPNLSRKIDTYHHHALLDGGSQSAKSSPLPHRRLDKLEGCIRDKPSPISMRRRLEALDDGCGFSPAAQDSPLSGRRLPPMHQSDMGPTTTRRNTDCGCGGSNRQPTDAYRDSPLMRRRVESDCGCSVTGRNGPMMIMSPQLSRRPAVMGEPGCFSSPVHRRNDPNGFDALNCPSPAKSVLGEPGVFASPARSISSVVSTIAAGDMCDELDAAEMEAPLQPDQTVVSGWLKFRDNKRWKIRWGVVTKLSPAADCLHLQLYRDSKDRYKNGQTKASLSLQQYLGCESGFTLDKESNTIAILCQDVIVVLAFDTRERLIQWQVKITNNLGDDIQYLVLVSSVPGKAKVATGPARMHVQDNRFCLTTGVPPKLAGLWDIAYLRRYGVVDGRFCFEGGSRCGKGEGLYVFVTDLGDEITHTLKLAAQGKLSTKRRGALSRKMSAMDSPRKQPMSPRALDDHTYNHDDPGNRTSYWPSQESRVDLDSNYGCGDTVSVSEMNDSFNHDSGTDLHFARPGVANIERCMSCISKLGAPSMSRSSTATGVGTPASGQPPNWSLLASDHVTSQQPINPAKLMHGLDRMSVCSSHGSYGSSGDSEYSVPRQTMCPSSDGWYEQPPTASCQLCPSTPRPPPKSNKPAMPLPVSHVGPYENYDVPRTPVQVEPSASGTSPADLYDTPKKIQEYLSKDANSNHSHTHHHQHPPQTIGSSDTYGNYDMPAMCGCLLRTASSPASNDDGLRTNCTCNRVMSWADNWISLPYCRRGNGIENTSLPINKVKLSGEGKMPVVQPSGELAIYATVDMAKKIRRKLMNEDGGEIEGDDDEEDDTCTTSDYQKTCDCLQENETESVLSSNYINLAPGEADQLQESVAANYTNLEFAMSLENYENAKEVLQKAGFSVGNLQETLKQCLPKTKLCQKCGHASRKPKGVVVLEKSNPDVKESNDKPEDYMLMEPGKSKRNLSGYLPMCPAAPPLPSKELFRRLIAEKSASNPSLCGPAVDRSRKRAENETRVPGSCMMNSLNSGVSPYSRKQLMDNSDDLMVGQTAADKRLNARKRSSSADSSRFIEESHVECSDSVETLRKSSLGQIEGRRSSSPCLHQETEHCHDDSCCVQSRPNEQLTIEDDTSVSTTTSAVSQSVSVYIRRSASVPCKAQNRDSSSSNDSGVSTGSMRPPRTANGEFPEFELPLTTSMSAARRGYPRGFTTTVQAYASLPRRSKSFDPLRDITFQFQRTAIQEKCSSAEAEIPICPLKSKEDATSLNSAGGSATGSGGPPYIDSRSTSSGTSDMSDYIETLSLSSHSSSDATGDLRLMRQPTSTMRPRSGKEYQNIDRSMLSLHHGHLSSNLQPSQLRSLLNCSVNYANITPVPENVESPSPGYQSGGSPQELIDPLANVFNYED